MFLTLRKVYMYVSSSTALSLPFITLHACCSSVVLYPVNVVPISCLFLDFNFLKIHLRCTPLSPPLKCSVRTMQLLSTVLH